MSVNTSSIKESAAERHDRRKRVEKVFNTFVFLRRVIGPPGHVPDARIITTLPHNFSSRPQQPYGTGVESIYFVDIQGRLLGRVGTIWQRFISSFTWNYSYIERVTGALQRLGRDRCDHIEYVVIHTPLLVQVYKVPSSTSLWRLLNL